jgi:hypothetical protein
VDVNHFSCPVCLDIPKADIFMCSNSHNICSDCHEKLPEPKNCPSCRQSYDEKLRRNFSMEQVVASLGNIVVKCKFFKCGCSRLAKKDEIVQHESLCPFQLVQCPAKDCGQQISMNGFISHCTRANHKLFNLGRAEFNLVHCSYVAKKIEARCVPGIWAWKDIPFMFFFEYVKEDDMSYFWVTLAGGKVMAKRYFCEIVLHNDLVDPPYRYRGPVLSIDKKIDYVARTTLGMRITRDVVLKYRLGEPAEGKWPLLEYPRLFFTIMIHERTPIPIVNGPQPPPHPGNLVNKSNT